MRRSGLLSLALFLVPASAALASTLGSNTTPIFDPGIDGVVGARLIARSHVAPEFPPAAFHAGMSGTVVLAAVIGADGAIDDVVVLDSNRPKLGFEAAATEALSKWRFEPATRDGLAVSSYRVVRMHFGGRTQDRNQPAYGRPEMIGTPFAGLGNAISARGPAVGGAFADRGDNRAAVSGPTGRDVIYEVNLPPTSGLYDRTQLIPSPGIRPQPTPIGRE